MSWLGAATASAIVWVLGAGVVRLFGVRQRREIAAFGYALGLVVVALLSQSSSMVDLQLGWPLVAGAALLAVIASWLFGAGARSSRTEASPALHTERPSARALRVALTFALLAWLALLGVLCLLEPVVEFDLLAIWAFKAAILSRETLASTSYLNEVTRAYSHLDYPLLWPFAMRFHASLMGGLDLGAVKVQALATLLCFAATFHALLRRSVERGAALGFTLVLVATPMFQAQLLRLTADGPLALFMLGCAGSVLAYVRRPERAQLLLAAGFGVGVLLTKNEGVALWAMLLASGMLAVWRAHGGRERRALALWLGLVPLTACSPWFLLRSTIPKLSEDYGGRMTPSNLLANVDRVGEVLRHAGPHFAALDDWGIVWPALAVALGLGVRHLREPGRAFLACAVLGSAAAYCAIYVITPWKLEELIEVSAARLMLHLLPVLILLCAEVLRSAGVIAGPESDDDTGRVAPQSAGSSVT